MVPSGLLPAESRSDSKACLLNELYPVSCLSRILCSEECNCPTFTSDYSPDYRCSNIGFGNPMASRPCIRFLRERAKPTGSCPRQDHRLCSCRRTPSVRFLGQDRGEATAESRSDRMLAGLPPACEPGNLHFLQAIILPTATCRPRCAARIRAWPGGRRTCAPPRRRCAGCRLLRTSDVSSRRGRGPKTGFIISPRPAGRRSYFRRLRTEAGS